MVTVVLKVGVLGHTGSDFEVAISHMGHLSCPCEGVPVQSLEEEALAPTSHPLCACSHTLRLGGVALLGIYEDGLPGAFLDPAFCPCSLG